ncbi:MAG: copper resistance protein [Rhodospirillales bacterium]|nr:copper resistance protein [Rhodospirillales bacterium]
MELLFDLFGFLDVVLRLIALATQALMIGGIAFILLVVLPFRAEIGAEADEILRRCRMLLRWGACIAVLGAVAYIIINVLLLYGSADVPISQGLMANFALAEMVRIGAAIGVFILASSPSVGAGRRWALALLAAILLIAAAVNSHSVSRMTGRVPMAFADGIHQLGASIWIGGIPYFIIALARTHNGIAWRRIGKRFSVMSMVSVAGLVLAGLVLAYVFVGSWQGLYGTSYGVMVIGKVALLGILLSLGFLNFRVVERLRADTSTPILRMRRFAEVEVGIGLSVFALAASITSSPPSIDQPFDQVPWSVTASRMSPVWPPRLISPAYDEMAIPALQLKLDAEAKAGANAEQHPRAYVPGTGVLVQRVPADIAWSEYNHHWAGVFVLVIGILAILEHSGWRGTRWTRHWPLVFLGLAAFLFIRSDPEDWPLGPIGFWESLKDAEPFQHKVIVLLVIVFGLFEWGVRTERLKQPWAPLVFPILTAIGGGMLLMHSHNISDVKEQFLIELTHIPLALLAVGSAWSRWLELRLLPPDNRVFRTIWPITYVLIGLLLLNYREA